MLGAGSRDGADADCDLVGNLSWAGLNRPEFSSSAAQEGLTFLHKVGTGPSHLEPSSTATNNRRIKT